MAEQETRNIQQEQDLKQILKVRRDKLNALRHQRLHPVHNAALDAGNIRDQRARRQKMRVLLRPCQQGVRVQRKHHKVRAREQRPLCLRTAPRKESLPDGIGDIRLLLRNGADGKVPDPR